MPLVVNGETVDEAVIRQEAHLLRPHMQEMMPAMDPIDMEKQLRDWSRENVIERILLKHEALSDPEPLPGGAVDEALEEIKKQSGGQANGVNSANEAAIRDDIETRLRMDRLIHKITSKVSPPKYKLVGEYYRKNKEQFKTPELVRASHIVKNVDENTDDAAALAAMERVRQELNEGANFEELADHYSDCKGNGGDLGYFPRGQMVAEFEQVVFSIKIGEISPIFRTPFGYHIAKVNDRKPPSIRGLMEVREEIERELHRQKQQRALEDFVDRLKAKATIQL
jgi:peptidyl-prolyl cis-trans isomerase C